MNWLLLLCVIALIGSVIVETIQLKKKNVQKRSIQKTPISTHIEIDIDTNHTLDTVLSSFSHTQKKKTKKKNTKKKQKALFDEEWEEELDLLEDISDDE